MRSLPAHGDLLSANATYLTLKTAHDRLVKGLSAFGALPARDEHILRELPLHLFQMQAHEDVPPAEVSRTKCALILTGVLCRQRTIGGKRQIISLHFPGEIADLDRIYLSNTDYTLRAVSVANLAFIPHEALSKATNESSTVRELLWRAILADAALTRWRLTANSHRTAYQSVASLFYEACVRMDALGLADEMEYALPVSQQMLADSVGISRAHVNRVMQDLRREGIIMLKENYLCIVDRRRLQLASLANIHELSLPVFKRAS